MSLAFIVQHTNSEESEEMFLYCTAQPDVGMSACGSGLPYPIPSEFRPVFELEPIDTAKYIPSLTNMQAS